MSKLTRFEVIDHRGVGIGRVLVANCDIETSYQDDGETLKVFLRDIKKDTTSNE